MRRTTLASIWSSLKLLLGHKPPHTVVRGEKWREDMTELLTKLHAYEREYSGDEEDTSEDVVVDEYTIPERSTPPMDPHYFRDTCGCAFEQGRWWPCHAHAHLTEKEWLNLC